MADTQATALPAPSKKAREGRSPGFPIIDLKKALERAEEFRVAEGKHSAPVASARKAWNFGDESVIGRRTIAALGYFGLFADEGAGDTRKVRLTDTALKILLDKQPISPERDKLIQTVALNPALHKELWDKWGKDLPSDVTIETYLVRDRGFSSGGATDFMAEYKNTLAFANLDKSDNMLPTNEGSGAENPPSNPQVGDLVQVEIGGVLQLEKPARVRAIQPHDGQDWIFIEGRETGILMTQTVVVEKKPADSPPGLTPPRLAEEKRVLQPGMKEEKASLDEGEAILTWPEAISAESVRDLEYWLKGVLNKAKRRAGITGED